VKKGFFARGREQARQPRKKREWGNFAHKRSSTMHEREIEFSRNYEQGKREGKIGRGGGTSRETEKRKQVPFAVSELFRDS